MALLLEEQHTDACLVSASFGLRWFARAEMLRAEEVDESAWHDGRES